MIITMYIILAIIIAVVGVVMIVKPEFIYELTESWKSYSESEPSKAYLLWTRLTGIVFLLVGVVGAVALLILE